MEHSILKFIYTFFLGLLLALFVGVGISVFYEEPEGPKEPDFYTSYNGGKEPTEAQREEEKKYQDAREEFEKTTFANYNRNVSMIALTFSVVLLAISIAIASKAKLLADGFMLGGVFVLFYSVMRSFASMNSKFSFGVVSVALVITIFLGYWKFIRPDASKKAPAKA